ncbi:MAG: SLC13 family permease [Oscillospiraceae bacterium]
MKRVIGFIKDNVVLVVSLAVAVISAVFVPPNRDYLGYVDYKVIILLFCLMAAVAGLRSLGVFDALSARLLSGTRSARTIAFILMNLCFFTSMLVTNDVALITFVPLTLGLYSGAGMSTQLIMTIVIETAAANLGSMMTPIGNPQNLLLYSGYGLTPGEFFSNVLLLGAVGYVLLCGCVLLVKRGEIKPPEGCEKSVPGIRAAVYGAVFAVCVLSVAGVVCEYICLAAALAAVLICDRSLLKKVDYSLLATFVCFFVFVGNIGSIPQIKSFIAQLLCGRELVVSALLSQAISNVPAAAMLSGFTDNYAALLKGVNIGGLGTPVASLASLISFRLYCADKDCRKGRFMMIFLAVNIVLFGIMLTIGLLLD